MAMSASGQIAEMTTMIGGAQSRFAHRGHMKGRAAYRRTQRRGSVVNALRAFLEFTGGPGSRNNLTGTDRRAIANFW